MKTIDTHAHILKKTYNEDLDFVIKKILDEDLLAINISYDLNSSKEVIDLNLKNKHLIPVIGIHPDDTKKWNEKMIDELEKLINKNVVAIGEIGLDYYHKDYVKEKQLIAFNSQIKLAQKYKLPIVVHCREALEDTLLIIKKYPYQKFLLHSWSGDLNMTKKYLSVSENIYFSYNGILTFKNSEMQKETIKEIPINRIMFETDCPYLTPVPFRGKINYPWRVKETIKYAAELLNMSFDELNFSNNNVTLEFYNINKEMLT